MVRQNLVVVTGPGGSVTHRPRWSPELAAGAAVALIKNKGTSRCRYINSLLNGQNNQSPDVRYTHLADEEARAATPNSSDMSSHRAAFILRVLAFWK